MIHAVHLNTWISRVIIVSLLFSLLGMIQPAKAAAITSITITASNLKVSELSDYVFLFTFTTSVTAGETIDFLIESSTSNME